MVGTMADDLSLFAKGSLPHPWRLLGAHPEVSGVTKGVQFRVWAPNARAVSVLGDFCAWDDARLPMAPIGTTGVWERFVPGARPGQLYQFAVHGADGRLRRKADPYGRSMQPAPGTASRIVGEPVPAWTDRAWLRARAAADPQRSPMRIYEVHLGSWRRGAAGEPLTYRQLAPLLAEHCVRYGFTHLELLPVAEHPFVGSWGYQVAGYYAPTARFGTPDDLRAMVDQLHAAGIGVILDWVPAHFPRDEHALARFDGSALYEHADPQRGEHPDWGTLIFDFGRPQVRNFLIGNARYWLEEFHFDGLRVDAVASMLYLDYSRAAGQWTPNRLGGRENLEAIDFLRRLNEEMHSAAPGAICIAEESTAFPGVTRPVADGGLGFDFKWDLGWMHDTLAYFRRTPGQRWRDRGHLTFRGVYLGSEHWVLPLSHDEVVHLKRSLLGKMPGDRPQQFASLRSLLANQVGQAGKKLLFMGSELAPGGEWDHDTPLAWEEAAEDPLRAGVAALVADLGTLYLSSPALWAGDADAGGFAWIDAERTAEPSVIAWLRRGAQPDEAAQLMVAVQNGGASVRRGYRLGLPGGGSWEEALNTESTRYGGTHASAAVVIEAEPIPWGGQPFSAEITVPALATIFLRPAASPGLSAAAAIAPRSDR